MSQCPGPLHNRLFVMLEIAFLLLDVTSILVHWSGSLKFCTLHDILASLRDISASRLGRAYCLVLSHRTQPGQSLKSW